MYEQYVNFNNGSPYRRHDADAPRSIVSAAKGRQGDYGQQTAQAERRDFNHCSKTLVKHALHRCCQRNICLLLELVRQGFPMYLQHFVNGVNDMNAFRDGTSTS